MKGIGMEWFYNEETGIHFAGVAPSDADPFGYATHIAYFTAETKRWTLRRRAAEDAPWVTVGEFADWEELKAQG